MSEESIRTLDRALNIIEELSKTPHGMNLVNLSAAVGLNKTTTLRMLRSLTERNYVSKDTETGKYRLTMRLFEIGSQVLGGLNVISVARPYLERISDLTGEAVHLVVMDDTDVVYIYKEAPMDSIVRMASKVGARAPLYCTGVGKSILAALPDEEVHRIWEKSNITKHTPNTIVDFPIMKKELSMVRKTGYAVDNEENETGVRCVSVAIRDYFGRPFAAMSVSAAVSRMDEEKLGTYSEVLISAANEISALLGNR